MSLSFHYHPLSSFCQKALIGLYELGVPFDKVLVDLGNEAERAALTKLWAMCRFPVLRDEARDVNVPETSIIQIRQILFLGGALSNQDFHAAGIC